VAHQTGVVAVVVLAVLTGCDTPDERPAAPPSPSAQPSQPGPTEVPGPDRADPAAGSAEVPRSVGCVPEESHMDASVAASSTHVTVGPLTWPGVRGWVDARPEDYGHGGNYKVGAVVRAGAVVTVTVAPEARSDAGLNYGQRWGFSPAQAVTFRACADRDTAFIGGFHVQGRRCVPFDVRVGDAAPVRVTIGFFAPCP
jgi:hypothetical protein